MKRSYICSDMKAIKYKRTDFIFYSRWRPWNSNITEGTTVRNSIDSRNISYMCVFMCRFVKHYDERESCRSSSRSVDVNSRLEESRRWYNVRETKGQATRSCRDHVSSHRRGLVRSNHLVSPPALTPAVDRFAKSK